MTSQTVKTPAGQSVEIVDDEDWLKLTDAQPLGLKQWTGQKPVLFRYLWEHGPISDKKSGRATSILHRQLRKAYPDDVAENITSITALLVTPINQPAFARDVNGKRTYSINLIAMPQTWYHKLMRDLKTSSNGSAKPQPEPAPPKRGIGDLEFVGTNEDLELPDEPPLTIHPAGAHTATVDIEMASQVAMSLLNSVVEVISSGGNNGQLRIELTDARNRLAQRLEENDKLRRIVAERNDEIVAIKIERDGLRQRLQASEANLQAALKGDSAKAVNAEIEKRIGAIMRERPSAKGA